MLDPTRHPLRRREYASAPGLRELDGSIYDLASLIQGELSQSHTSLSWIATSEVSSEAWLVSPSWKPYSQEIQRLVFRCSWIVGEYLVNWPQSRNWRYWEKILLIHAYLTIVASISTPCRLDPYQPQYKAKGKYLQDLRKLVSTNRRAWWAEILTCGRLDTKLKW